MPGRKYLIAWVGSYAKRIIKGINEVEPYKLFLVLESRSPSWLEFAEENCDKVIKWYGNKYQDPARAEKIPIPVASKPFEDYYVTIAGKLCEIVAKIRDDDLEAEITIDYTAAPGTVRVFLSDIARLVARPESPIFLQYTEKKLKSDPKYYAPENSDYFRKHISGHDEVDGLSLGRYRELESEDEGGKTRTTRFSPPPYGLLDDRSPEGNFRRALLVNVPPSDERLSSSGPILAEVMGSPMAAKKFGYNKGKNFNRWVKNLTTESLKEWNRDSYVELDQTSRSFRSKRTQTGDFIAHLIERLYMKK